MHLTWAAAWLLWCCQIEGGSPASTAAVPADSCSALALPEPVPLGLDLEVDAALRRIFEGNFSKIPPYPDPAYLRAKYTKIAPLYLHERTCGNSLGARQLVVRLGDWSAGDALEEENQMELLHYYKWVVESYWAQLTPDYRLEPKLLLIIDFAGVGWSTVIHNGFRIQSLIAKAGGLLHLMKGKSWDKAFIMNPPRGFSLIWKALVTLGDFRQNDVLVVKTGDASFDFMLRTVGQRCLAREVGGSSPVPLGQGAAEAALARLASASAGASQHADFRIDPLTDGNFPDQVALAQSRAAIQREEAVIAEYRHLVQRHVELSQRDAGESPELLFERQCILRDQTRIANLVAQARKNQGIP